MEDQPETSPEEIPVDPSTVPDGTTAGGLDPSAIPADSGGTLGNALDSFRTGLDTALAFLYEHPLIATTFVLAGIAIGILLAWVWVRSSNSAHTDSRKNTKHGDRKKGQRKSGETRAWDSNTQKERYWDDLQRRMIETTPYNSKMLLTNEEHKFWTVLKAIADDNGWNIAIKPKMIDFMKPLDREDYEAKYRKPYPGDWMGGESRYMDDARRAMGSKHVDFLILDRNARYTKFAIEYDDSNHETNENTKKNDAFKNAVFDAIGNYPLIRIKYKDKWTRDELALKIETEIEKWEQQRTQARYPTESTRMGYQREFR